MLQGGSDSQLEVIDLDKKPTSEWSTSPDEQEKQGTNNRNKQVQTVSKRIRKQKETQQLQRRQFIIQLLNNIQLPIQEEYMYNLNGDHPLYIKQFDENSHPYTYAITKIEEFQSFIKLIAPSQKCLKDYQIPIKLLEQQQDQDKYDLAQYLKIVQQIVYKTEVDIHQILNDYQYHLAELSEINSNRKKLRQKTITDFIKHHLNEDDFFLVTEIGANFELVQTNVISYSISKPLLSLIGFDNQEASSYLLHVGLIGDIFLSDKQRFNLAVMDAFTNLGTSRKYEKFTIKTMDKILITCDMEMIFLNINYPQEVLYSRSQSSSYQDLDQVMLLKYDIQSSHIEKVLQYRLSHKNTFLYDYKVNQSLEYSLLSQILIEKYYPSHVKMLQNKSNKPDQLLQCGFKESNNSQQNLSPPLQFFQQN